MIGLSAPDKIVLSQEVRQLLEQVDESKTEFDQLRPLTPETEDRIKMAFLPDRVTASLNMEGIIATRRQTLAIMDSMTISESASKSEQEIHNALKADEYVYETAMKGEELSEKLIREIHALIEHNVGERPGSYRPRDVKISQAQFTPPDFTEVPLLMCELVKIFCASSSVNSIMRAAWLHNRFTHIHPFLDGNGRTARLLQDHTLLRGQLFPTGVPSSLRDDYYDALAGADNDDWDGLVEILANRQLAVISKAAGIANERKERQEWVAALASRARSKKRGTQHKNYLVWAHRMQEIQSAFEAAALELRTESEVLLVRHENHEIIDFPTWREICQRGRARQTWFFTQSFSVDGELVFKCVFYFRRHSDIPQDPFHHTDDLVSLFVTGGPPGADYDFGRFSDSEIRLREILFYHENLYAYEFEGEKFEGKYGDMMEKWNPKADRKMNDVVREFFGDIFVKKAGL